MRDEDQKLRNKWVAMYRKGKTESDKFKELTDQAIASDRANTARMREIVEEYGWPTYDRVGRGPSNNAWLIVQHADRNPLFQAKCLPLLKEAVDAGQANSSNYAYLYDRVRVSRGEKQLYATQSWTNNGLNKGSYYPIGDESNVQKRREEMSVDRTVVENAQSMGFEYTIPTVAEADARAEQLNVDYQNALKKAKAAMSEKAYAEAADHYIEATRAYGHVTTQDFIEATRALSLAEHAEIGEGATYLTRALARGWDGFDQVKTDPDFAYLRESSPSKWADLLIVAEQMSLDKQLLIYTIRLKAHTLTSKQLFLIDGIGAVISAFFLGVILVQLEALIGMPENVLYPLAALAVIFACYSLSCYFISPTKWRLYLKIIATVNTLYSFLTLGLVLYHYTNLTILGLAYFIAEILILIGLIRAEIKLSKM